MYQRDVAGYLQEYSHKMNSHFVRDFNHFVWILVTVKKKKKMNKLEVRCDSACEVTRVCVFVYVFVFVFCVVCVCVDVYVVVFCC